jgi:hypothetical protein
MNRESWQWLVGSVSAALLAAVHFACGPGGSEGLQEDPGPVQVVSQAVSTCLSIHDGLRQLEQRRRAYQGLDQQPVCRDDHGRELILSREPGEPILGSPGLAP